MCNFFFFFFNLTIEVVTFRLRGWCVLGVFLLLTFTCLGHECKDILSPWNAYVQRLDLGLNSHPKELDLKPTGKEKARLPKKQLAQRSGG